MFLQGSNIEFSYEKNKPILKGISFQVPKGHTLAVVGASGCGKSTLLRLIAGLLPKTTIHRFSGDIVFYDKFYITPNWFDASRCPKGLLTGGDLAFMFQEANLLPNLSVHENVAFPLTVKGETDDPKVKKLLERVGLLSVADYLPKQLSGGMKTRVAMARSFITNPKLLLLDEPFSALDVSWRSKLYLELEKLKEYAGSTVVMVTHDIQEALLLADIVLVLGKAGRVLYSAEVDKDTPVMARLESITAFGKTERFLALHSAIQELILLDGLRETAEDFERMGVLSTIERAAGHAELEKWYGMKYDLVALRNFVDDEEIHGKLYSAFKQAVTVNFKYCLVWDILAFRGISASTLAEISNFYLDHLPSNTTSSLEYYALRPTDLFDFLVHRKIQTPETPPQKRWIYLCDLYAVPDHCEVKRYLEDVSQGKNEWLKGEFNQKIAKNILEKLTCHES